MRGLLLYNPQATSTNARVRDEVIRALASGFSLQVQPTEHRHHATEIAAKAVAEQDVEIVFSLGGDGTANETLQGLAGTDMLFAPIPGGGSNVLARTLGLPNQPVAACHQLCEAARADRVRTIGLGMADERWFAFSAGFGFDAAVVKRVEGRPRFKHTARQLAFVWCGFAEWFAAGAGLPAEIHLIGSDGVPGPAQAIAIVGNSDPYTFLGPRALRVTPQATFATGLDLLTMDAVSTRRILGSIRRAFGNGSHVDAAHATYAHDLREFTLLADRPRQLMVDGDHVGEFSEVTFRAVPDALRILV
ncbi:MAG: diacylglycerol kinase family enzyme [Glaciecola sp.]|jgi:diacylglycerol kinase family enzyme